MLCYACARPAGVLCDRCAGSLRRIPPRRIAGVLAEAAYAHAGAAATLVRNLKYRGCPGSGALLAESMVELLPPDATCLVPVPRSVVRRIRHGIDPGRSLAASLSARTGVPVVDAVRAPVWWPKRAGRAATRRRAVAFSLRAPLPDGAVLVDDVLTTGRTAASVIALAGGTRLSMVTATAAGTMGSRAETIPARGGGVAQDRHARDSGPQARRASPLRTPWLHGSHAPPHRPGEEDG